MNPESPPAEVPKTSESVENTMGYDPCPVCKAIQNIESKFWIGCDVCGTMMSAKVSLLHLMKKRIFAVAVARNVELDDVL